MWEVLKKEAIDCDITELQTKKTLVKKLKIFYMSFIIILYGVAFYFLIKGGIYAVGTIILIFYATLVIILLFDVANDVNRINMWIYMKRGEKK